MADNAGLAAALDGIPMVADAAARDARFPVATRKQNQRVFRLDTGVQQRWSGSAWLDDGVLVVSVARFGAVGDDSTDNAAAFVATKAAADAVASATGAMPTILFPAGIYRTSATQNWFTDGVTLQAEGRVILRSTATSGNIVEFDAGAATNGYRARMLGDFVLDSVGTGPAIALYVRNVNHSQFQARVKNVTSAALKVDGCVLSRFDLTCSHAGGAAFTVTPTNGVVIDGSAANTATTACEFDLIVEDTTGDGVVLTKADNCVFRGTSEGLPGVGVTISANCHNNLFDAFFCEGNTGSDIVDNGSGTIYRGCAAQTASTRSVIFGATSARCQWYGGTFHDAEVLAGGIDNEWWGFKAAIQVYDAGTRTTIKGLQPSLSVIPNGVQLPTLDPWVALTTAGTWANTSGTFQSPQYTINRAGNEILVRGEVGGGSSGTAIATLPVGFRPSKQVTFTCPSTTGGTPAYVSVSTAGVITHLSGNTTSIALLSIRFYLG